jgi:hypothetical protein
MATSSQNYKRKVRKQNWRFFIMANIHSNDLQLNEAELLADNETYMDELSEDELGLVAGGITPLPAISAAAAASSGGCAAAAGAIGASIGAGIGAVWGALD